MTATKEHPASTREFELGHYRFHRDGREQLVFVPSGPGLDGYLAFDLKENQFVQVRLLKTDDAEKRSTFLDVWKRICDRNENTVCPEILAYGEEESVPYYVCSLPAGEPVSYFTKRNGPMPPEVAAAMVLKFVRSIKAQNPVSHEDFAMSPETLWITRSHGEPKIILGDICPVATTGAEAANSLLCLDLLKFLSGNPPFNEGFQALVTSIEKGPRVIGYAAEKLDEYCKACPAESYWTDYNQPEPLLHQLVPPEVALQSVEALLKNDPVQRPLWQYALGIGLAAALFGILGMAGLLYFSGNAAKPVVNREREIAEPISQTLAETAEVKSETVIPAPATAEPEVAATGNDETWQQLQKPLPKLPPVDATEAAPPEKPVAAIPEVVASVALADPVATPVVNPPAIEIPSQPQTREEILVQIANEAAEARSNNQIVEAIDKEIAYLKSDPKSIDARMRLNDDLFELQQAVDRPFSPRDISILEEVTAFNAKAQDILIKHYRDTENWDLEIASLVKFGRAGRPDKLSEAGERIFQNPAASDLDRQTAGEYFIEAAREGDSGAQFFAGECMILGRGGNIDFTRGIYHLRMAISAGDARAMDLLGVCYVRAWGVPRDDSKAVELFQAAIEKGNIPAHYNLGARYAQGQGVERDPTRAADIFEAGCAQGNAHCMLVFARCFEAGYGREQDNGKAVYWFSKSAEKGNSEAIKWCSDHQVDYPKGLVDSGL